MKKLLLLALVAVLSLVGLGVTGLQAATNPSNGFVVVRCTITISVNVLGTCATWYINGKTANGAGVTCNQTYYSGASSITVINDSSGALTKWDLHVSTIQKLAVANDPSVSNNWITLGAADDTSNGGWILGPSNGINQAALYGIFKTTGTDGSGDFAASGATFTVRSASDPQDTYQTRGGGGRFAPVAPTNEFATAISAGSANWVAPVSVGRGLGLAFQTPTAVTDQDWRRFVIMVTASTN